MPKAGRPALLKLFNVLMNAAINPRSRALPDRADALLTLAVWAGHAEAIVMSVAWPHLRAEAERRFQNTGAG